MASQLPPSFTALLGQQQAGVQDYGKMDQAQLSQQLQMLVCPNHQAASTLPSPSYVLTPDNLLKMALIHLRIQAGIPMCMLGDTGCGKTSLLRHLADMVGVHLVAFNVHAGTSQQHIQAALQRAEQAAEDRMEDCWLFLDEVNTCCHLGLIADLVVHRCWMGRPIDPRVVPLAACNPYRLKPVERLTAGLAGKVRRDDASRLVYR